jgi:hypothetical protein
MRLLVAQDDRLDAHSMVLAALMLAWLLGRSSFECSDASVLRCPDTWLPRYFYTRFDIYFACFKGDDRLNAVLLLPVIAGVPGGLVSRFDTCFHACFDSCVDTRFEPCF